MNSPDELPTMPDHIDKLREFLASLRKRHTKIAQFTLTHDEAHVIADSLDRLLNAPPIPRAPGLREAAQAFLDAVTIRWPVEALDLPETGAMAEALAKEPPG